MKYAIEILEFMLKNKKALLIKREMKTKNGKELKEQKEKEVDSLKRAIKILKDQPN